MTRGLFISLEGTEGAGKSTVLQFVKNQLAAAGIEAVMTREPGGTELAEEIRQVLLHPKSSETMAPQAELLLMFAGRAQHMHACILPALSAGKWVVSDRFVDASYAYQGGGRGIAMEQINQVDKWVVGDCYPNLTLLLDLPAELGLARTLTRGGQKDRIEQERVEFFMRVRDVYLQRAKQDPKCIKIIDASLALPLVLKQVSDVLNNYIEKKS